MRENVSFSVEQIMESNTDAEQWRMEVERVAPQLKVQYNF